MTEIRILRLEGDRWVEVGDRTAPGAYRGYHKDEFGFPGISLGYRYPENTKFNFEPDDGFKKYLGGLGDGEESEKS